MLKVFCPAQSQDVRAEVVAAHDFFDVVAALQIEGKPAGLAEIVCGSSGHHRPAYWTLQRRFAADFSDACRPVVIPAHPHAEFLSRTNIHAGLPDAVHRLVAPCRLQRRCSSKREFRKAVAVYFPTRMIAEFSIVTRSVTR